MNYLTNEEIDFALSDYFNIINLLSSNLSRGKNKCVFKIKSDKKDLVIRFLILNNIKLYKVSYDSIEVGLEYNEETEEILDNAWNFYYEAYEKPLILKRIF